MIKVNDDLCLKNGSVIGIRIIRSEELENNHRYYVDLIISNGERCTIGDFSTYEEAKQYKGIITKELFSNTNLLNSSHDIELHPPYDFEDDCGVEFKATGIKDYRDLLTRATQSVLLKEGLFNKKEFTDEELNKIKSGREFLLKKVKDFASVVEKVVEVLENVKSDNGDDKNV